MYLHKIQRKRSTRPRFLIAYRKVISIDQERGYVVEHKPDQRS